MNRTQKIVLLITITFAFGIMPTVWVYVVPTCIRVLKECVNYLYTLAENDGPYITCTVLFALFGLFVGWRCIEESKGGIYEPENQDK